MPSVLGFVCQRRFELEENFGCVGTSAAAVGRLPLELMFGLILACPVSVSFVPRVLECRETSLSAWVAGASSVLKDDDKMVSFDPS